MNLCIVASGDYFSSYGGGQVYVKNLVSGLHRRGHTISVISIQTSATCTEPSSELIYDGEIQIYQLSLPDHHIDLAIPYELQPFVLETIQKTLSSIMPDLIHAHGWKYASAEVCHQKGIPCAITAHHGGIVCPSGALLNQFDTICTVPASLDNCLQCALHFVPGGDFWSPVIQKLPLSLSLGIAKSLKSIRNIPYTSPAFQTPLGIRHKMMQIDILRQAPDRIIAPSHAIATALIANGIPEEKVVVIPHGITPLTPKPLDPGLPERPIRLGYVGRITYVKGLHLLIDALKLLPPEANYELHVFGDAATRNEKHYAQMLRDSSEKLTIIWHGKIDNTQVQKAYHSFDVMIHPAIYLEVFGLTLLESLSSGRPVIATRCGGPEDFIEDGVDGFLVAPNDADQLAQAIKKFLKDPNLAEKISKTIHPINTLEKHIDDVFKMYLNLRT